MLNVNDKSNGWFFWFTKRNRGRWYAPLHLDALNAQTANVWYVLTKLVFNLYVWNKSPCISKLTCQHTNYRCKGSHIIWNMCGILTVALEYAWPIFLEKNGTSIMDIICRRNDINSWNCLCGHAGKDTNKIVNKITIENYIVGKEYVWRFFMKRFPLLGSTDTFTKEQWLVNKCSTAIIS